MRNLANKNWINIKERADFLELLLEENIFEYFNKGRALYQIKNHRIIYDDIFTQWSKLSLNDRIIMPCTTFESVFEELMESEDQSLQTKILFHLNDLKRLAWTK